jgi:glycogen(starch) synthase
MRILHLASEFPPARIFGLGRYVHDLARAQVRRGHEIHVMTNSLSGKDQDGEMHGIRAHRIHFPSPPMPADGATQVTQFNWCLLERLLEIESAIGKPDVVVAHDWLTMLASHAIRRLWGGRLIVTIHDTVIGKTFGRMSNEDKFIANIERWGCREADAVVAVSRHVAKELTGVYEAPPQKVHVVPCAVDPRWFQTVDCRYLEDLRSSVAEPGDFIISYVGRLDPEKGVDRLVEAASRALRKHSRIRIVAAGKGKERPRLEALTRSLGIQDRVSFLDYVSGPALEALYRISQLLVCPSLYEPFGIVPLEGMINGIPVIVSDTGGMSEIVEDERSGLKVPPGDAIALEKAILRMIENPEEARRMANEGQERAKRVYSWERVAELVEEIYTGAPKFGTPLVRPRPKLTAGIRVKNGERYAEECLRDLCEYVDEIVVLDDGSTDRTIQICRSFPKVTQVVRWEKDFFHEGIDRNVVLALAKNTNPDWILFPDIDEVFESRFKTEIESMMRAPDVGMYAFLFCHFWRSRTHYRVDGKWGKESRSFPIPRLVRSQPSLHYL